MSIFVQIEEEIKTVLKNFKTITRALLFSSTLFKERKNSCQGEWYLKKKKKNFSQGWRLVAALADNAVGY